MARQRAIRDISGRNGPTAGGVRFRQLERAGAAPAASPQAGAILGRRPGRATPRTILGALLVAAAAVVVFAIAMNAAGGSRSSFAVAAHALPAGSTIGPGDLTSASMNLSGATKAAAFSSPAALVGRTVAVPVGAGQLIEAPMLAAPTGSGLRPVSVAVDGNSLAALSAGNAVDVLAFAASTPASATPSSTVVVLRGATLLSINRGSSGLLGSSSAGSTVVVTLGVGSLDEAEAVIAAAHSGTIELVMAEPADGHGPDGTS